MPASTANRMATATDSKAAYRSALKSGSVSSKTKCDCENGLHAIRRTSDHVLALPGLIRPRFRDRYVALGTEAFWHRETPGGTEALLRSRHEFDCGGGTLSG
jgi:hypothetical protein